MPPRTKLLITHLTVFILLGTAIALLYANTYHFPFYFDDSVNITSNVFLVIDDLSWDNLRQAATSGPNPRRWLPNLSFALNHYFDGYNPLGYHLANTAIHIVVAFAFYLLASLTLGLPSLAGRFRPAAEIACMATLLWALHPLQTNAVTYIVQRMTSMASLFYLLALYFYAKGRLAQIVSRRLIFFTLTLLLGGMALYSKENSGILPATIIAYELLLLRRPSARFLSPRIIFFLVAGALVFLGICWLFLGSTPLNSILNGFEGRGFTLGERLLTQTRIVVHYLSVLVLPLPSRLNLQHLFTVSTGLLTPPQTLLAIMLLGALVLFLIRLSRAYRLAAFIICWLLLNLVVESSVIPLELIYEHRMYLPAMFPILATVALGYRLAGKRPAVVRTLLLLVLALSAVATWQRNTTWDNPIRLWTDVVNKSPDSMRGWVNLGSAYSGARKYRIAESCLLKGLALAQEAKSGKFANQKVKKRMTAASHENLALIYREVGQYEKALEHATTSLELNPARTNPLLTLGITYAKMDQHSKAISYYEQAWAGGLDSVDLYNNWAVTLYTLGKVDRAISLLQKALRIDPNHAESHYNLGIAYSSKGLLQEARQEMERAMQLQQKNYGKRF